MKNIILIGILILVLVSGCNKTEIHCVNRIECGDIIIESDKEDCVLMADDEYQKCMERGCEVLVSSWDVKWEKDFNPMLIKCPGISLGE